MTTNQQLPPEKIPLRDLGWDDFFEQEFRKQARGALLPARVFLVRKDRCLLYSEEGEIKARLAGSYRHQTRSRRELPTVGDWVLVERRSGHTLSVIRGLLPRKSLLVRKLPGGRKRTGIAIGDDQVIAANMDFVFIVVGLDQDFNLRRLERYLTLATNSAAKPVVILNKKDLCPDSDTKAKAAKKVIGDTPLHLISATEKSGLDEIRKYLEPGKTVVLVGSSGVGKSTIINALLGEQRQKVQEISEKIGKGKHTTTHRELILFPEGGLLIDNPGVREIQLAGEEDLSEAFPDIAELAENCRFNDCRHRVEPGCAIREAVDKGQISRDRYASFLKLHAELEELQRKY